MYFFSRFSDSYVNYSKMFRLYGLSGRASSVFSYKGRGSFWGRMDEGQ